MKMRAMKNIMQDTIDAFDAGDRFVIDAVPANMKPSAADKAALVEEMQSVVARNDTVLRRSATLAQQVLAR